MAFNPNRCITAEEAAAAAEVGLPDMHPILIDGLSEDLQRRFGELLRDIDALTWEYEENVNDENDIVACLALYTRVAEEVAARPVLTKAVTNDGWSLLSKLCERSNYEESCRTIQVLIETNPYALLWEYPDVKEIAICAIADSPKLCVIMPWIAEHFTWVFDSKSCRVFPCHDVLVDHYIAGHCDALVVRQFYEFYPQGITQKRDDGEEENVLHSACRSLSHELTTGLAELCCFLAAKRPESVRMASVYHELPIHLIMPYCHRVPAQKVILHLLRAYPQCIDIATEIPHPFGVVEAITPRSNPFVNRVFPVLEEERVSKEEIICLTDASAAWCEATQSSQATATQIAASDIFSTWTTLRIDFLKQMVEHTIPEHLANICLECKATDLEEAAEAMEE